MTILFGIFLSIEQSQPTWDENADVVSSKFSDS